MEIHINLVHHTVNNKIVIIFKRFCYGITFSNLPYVFI